MYAISGLEISEISCFDKIQRTYMFTWVSLLERSVLQHSQHTAICSVNDKQESFKIPQQNEEMKRRKHISALFVSFR